MKHALTINVWLLSIIVLTPGVGLDGDGAGHAISEMEEINGTPLRVRKMVDGVLATSTPQSATDSLGAMWFLRI